ncbi:MAG: hypothetical protein KBG84_10360 [Planctomycetes bacterium]|nr:hypothetical protein [Planctomycetota bacterium]
MVLIWRLRIFMIIGGIVAFVFGAHHTYTGLTNTSPTSLSYVEYCRQRPDAKWLELTDTWVDYRASVEIYEQQEDRHTKKRGSITKREYYTALYQGTENEGNIVAFLKCNDPSSVALAREGVEASNMESEKWENWCVQNESRMISKTTVKGLVLSGLSESSEYRKLLNDAAKGQLDPNFVIIDQNEEPKSGMGFLLLILGVALLGGTAATFVVGGSQKPAPYIPIAQSGYPAGNPAARPLGPKPAIAGTPHQAPPRAPYPNPMAPRPPLPPHKPFPPRRPPM